ncbi:NAD-P-binding protein [Lentinus tigrinus ALCF2SS1-7]|uniref:NAD-P-binding protein n=1 Tax=Lentinus tigrinus ALCF2SS1-6 TaxID=1328759 RepID=A0A5C2SD98_9APHY|nr:NAD-P-binding protein [Lentinus tigrinus ALCF2SS1-6]RPD75999.1 NAD-P-binding protein [Lentinus tigrinus ALCF2SS1-7]
MSENHVWLITGANRGIGLELVKQLLQSPSNTVIAGCRSPSKAADLQGLAAQANGRLHLVALDVSSQESVTTAAVEVARIPSIAEKGIDYLVNNAGILPGGYDTAFGMDFSHLEQTFNTNVIGPARVAQAFVGLVEKSTKKTIVNISSTMGSIGSDPGAHGSSYAISKTALNMLTYKEAKEKSDITVISMCPGWLQTDLGGSSAPLHVSVGVEGIIKTVAGLTPSDSGKFFNMKGEIVPW